MTTPLLTVQDLAVSFPGQSGPVRAVDGASFELNPGGRLVIAGESGSGKSLLCRSLLGIQPETATVSGKLEWKGQSLVSLSRDQWRPLRGASIAMIFQDPTAALNPLLSVGRQIIDAIRAHRRCPRDEARARAVEVLGMAGLPDPEHRLTNYPSELSGGMRQRVAIALALSAGPELIIADEATTNLDVSIQAQIVKLLRRLRLDLEVALIFVTHDLDLAAEVGGDLMVMYAGQPVEMGDVQAVLADPCHPYTRGLLRSAPTLRTTREVPLQPIPGQAPKPGSVGAGAPFRDRCPVAVEGVCALQRPGWSQAAPGHRVACHRFEKDGRAGLP
ncbi:ABC transporter ATP-binding protein [Frigidibacter sp. ROC022]|uniref:ABC transporter ATP-binding protein n=1 Tax=Frigidibacter sp. ROC022 TaxID=2971796 RepID=UPI00215B111D|nr:ABC transporter ATP-binding protein [Frigidibacter sp. ROC022]MCR8726378.1 ABC transporter ATP-binding protein [Frigidibacter sp. ROC022]